MPTSQPTTRANRRDRYGGRYAFDDPDVLRHRAMPVCSSGKETVVLDPDPEAHDQWRALLEARPDDEPLWTSLTAVLLDHVEGQRDTMPLNHRLKAQSPALAQSAHIFGDQLRTDLRTWVLGRVPGHDTLFATPASL